MGALVDTPSNWETASTSESPAETWESRPSVSETINDERHHFYSDESGDRDLTVEYIGSASLPTKLYFTWEIKEAPATGSLYFYYINGGAAQRTTLTSTVGDTGTIAVTVDPDSTFQFGVTHDDSGSPAGYLLNGGWVAVGEAETGFNCTFETDENARTLSDLRSELLVKAGFASVASNPPPGIATLADSYLDTAQKYLYRKYKALETTRYFTWQMEEGIRFYDLPENIDHDGAPHALRLDRYEINSVWVEDDQGVWYGPLIRGIPPTYYTFITEFGWPSHFEIRGCLEIYPPPADAYKLRVLGRFGLQDFSDDGDYTSIDPNLVLWYATALWRNDRGQTRSADVHFAMVSDYLKELAAGTHAGARYIPGARPVPIPTPPKMDEFDA